MKSLLAIIFTFFLLTGVTSLSAQTYDTTWTHHEIKSLNLQFDLPTQFYFDRYDSTGFTGGSLSATIVLTHYDEEIIGFEAMGSKLYAILGIDEKAFPISDDPHYQHGTTLSGYYMVGTIINIEDVGEQALCFLMSDKSNPHFNFFLMGQYGGTYNSGSSGYSQSLRFMKSVGPIVKTE